jgi:hypothetical protein
VASDASFQQAMPALDHIKIYSRDPAWKRKNTNVYWFVAASDERKH